MFWLLPIDVGFMMRITPVTIFALAAMLLPLQARGEIRHYAVMVIAEVSSRSEVVSGYAEIEMRNDGRIDGKICAYEEFFKGCRE